MDIKKRAGLFVVFGILISSLSLGCIDSGKNLEGTSWNLESYLNNEGNLTNLIPDTKSTIAFDKEKISGNSGCNGFFSIYEVKGSSIKLGAIGSTLMYCAIPGVMEQEQTILMRLDTIKSYKIEGNKLSFIDENNKVVLVYSKTN